MLPEKITYDVGEDVVGNDEEGRDDEPNEAFVKVMDHEPSLHGHEQRGNDYPTEQPELVLEVPLFQAQDECQETDNHQHETDETVICQQRADYRVPHAYNRDLISRKTAQGVVINCQEDVPIEILCHRYILLLLLIPLDRVQLDEYQCVQKQYQQHAVEMPCRQY